MLTPQEELDDLRDQLAKAEAALSESVRSYCPGPHKFVQHRDAKPPWCRACGRDRRGTLRKSRVTKTNPSGSIQQCDRRDLHAGHEYQAEFGAYFNTYCPGNSGGVR